MNGVLEKVSAIHDIPVRYDVIRDEQSLRDWVGRMEELYDDRIPGVDPEHILFAVDCEWHGRTHVDGQLRTIQFAWTESDAVVIEFRNEKNEWSFLWLLNKPQSGLKISNILGKKRQPGKDGQEIFGFICSIVSFKDTLTCQSSIHSRYHPHRP